MTSRDRRAILRYTLATWWYTRGPWTHIFITAGLICAFELAFVRAAYPWLIDRVSVTL